MAVEMKRVRTAVEDHLKVAYQDVGYMEVSGGSDVVVLARFHRRIQEGETSNLAPGGVAAFYVAGTTNTVKLFIVA